MSNGISRMWPKAKYACAALALGFACSTPVHSAGAYPSGPITIVVPFAAGGASDMTARLIGQQLGDKLHTSVVVENRAGANSQIGTNYVAHAKPDGYTLLLGTSSLVNNPHLYAHLPYNAARDLRAVIGLVDVPAFLLVGSKVQAKDTKAFITMAQKSNGQLNYSSAGTGSTLHLAAEWLKENAHFDALHVAQRGSGPSVMAVATGQVDFSMENYGPARAMLQAGKVRVLAIGSPKRFPALPDVPTLQEAGLPATNLSSWFTLMAPAATPDSTVNLLNAKINEILKEPEIRQRLIKEGLVPLGGSPADITRLMQEDSAKWSAIIKSAHVKVE